MERKQHPATSEFFVRVISYCRTDRTGAGARDLAAASQSARPATRSAGRAGRYLPNEGPLQSFQLADLHLPTDVARASAGHLSPHIPDVGEHGYGDEEKDQEEDDPWYAGSSRTQKLIVAAANKKGLCSAQFGEFARCRGPGASAPAPL